MRIEDGKGRGFVAEVNGSNRLLAEAVSFSGLHYASEERGTAFSLPTDFIALTTTASFTGVLYIQNTSSKDMLIWCVYASNNMASCEWKVFKKPTTGTLISAGTVIVPVNLNFGSAETINGVYKKGVDAQTVTDGTLLAQWINGIGQSFYDTEGALILKPNDAIAIVAKPSVAGDVACRIVFTDEEPTHG